MAFVSDTDDSPSRGSRPSRGPSTAPSDSFLDRLRSTASPALPDAQGRRPSSVYGRGSGEPSDNDFDEQAYYRELGISDDQVSDFPRSSRSDIFASPSPPRPFRAGPSDARESGSMGDDPSQTLEWDDVDEEMELEDMDDVRKLGLVWTRERGTVEIMQWEGELMDTILDKLEQQQKMVAALRSDPQTSEEEHFKLILVQTESERIKYLVRSYLRTRLQKVERYSYHITETPETHSLLSGAELSHAQRYTELLHTHYQHSVLDSLPESFRRLDETYGDGMSMITKPNRQVPVLIYVRQDCGEITLESGDTALLAKGTTHLVKYSLVDRWVNLGWVEVL